MLIKIYTPKDFVLKKLIECFYICYRDENDSPKSYLTFPTSNCSLVAFVNSDVINLENIIQVKYNKNNSFHSYLTSKFTQPKLIQYQGKAKEINIYFKPLGINEFLDKNLSYYIEDFFTPFIPFDDYENSMREILKTESFDEIAYKIEKYWLSKHKGFEHPFLHKALDIMTKDTDIQISEIAEICGTTLKTLNKHFKTHLAWSPSGLKRIIRFRKILQSIENKNFKDNLTEISYLHNYFDQSHMIKEFKALTGTNPKEFFKELYSHSEGNIHWKFQ